jgi:hypothetical protein
MYQPNHTIKNKMRKQLILALGLLPLLTIAQTSETTFAEKLGFPKGKKVIIMHIDDAGMSYDSNLGTIKALKEGVANSVSVMMPTPWVPGFLHFLKDNPDVDAGLHLTLTSEWKSYRWGPLAGKPAVPSLVDKEGALWRSVPEVVQNGTPDEVEREIMAQIERARVAGFEPTHLDSHMGTLFATPEFLERYVKVGIREKIPVMLPAGHNSLILKSEGLSKKQQDMIQQLGQHVWASGLPVLDDLHNQSYGWIPDNKETISKEDLQKFKTKKYIAGLKEIKPGLTMVIMHCTHPTEVFEHISDSGLTREGDLLAMIDPDLKAYIEKEGIILTTWREVMKRRQSIK